MEMACDEMVMQKLGENIRSEYAQSLLDLTTGKRLPFGVPLAFCKKDAKLRIRNIMAYKKPL